MTKTILVSAAAALLALASAPALADDHEILEKVMKEGMKGDSSPIAKTLKGEASDEEIKELATLIKSMHGTKAPEGGQAAYESKVAELIAAMDAVAGGDKSEGSITKLKSASNCKACHSDHKP